MKSIRGGILGIITAGFTICILILIFSKGSPPYNRGYNNGYAAGVAHQDSMLVAKYGHKLWRAMNDSNWVMIISEDSTYWVHPNDSLNWPYLPDSEK
jgi:hypothetical protein